jgi:hypothetical protein
MYKVGYLVNETQLKCIQDGRSAISGRAAYTRIAPPFAPISLPFSTPNYVILLFFPLLDVYYRNKSYCVIFFLPSISPISGS